MSTDATESTNDLSKPLGLRPKKKKRFVVPMWVVSRSIAGALGLCVAVLVGWILFVDEPFGGEPMVMVSAGTSPKPKPGEPSANKSDTAAPAASPRAKSPDRPSPSSTARPASARKCPSARPAPRRNQKANTKAEVKPDASDRSALARNIASRADPENRARRRAPVRGLRQAAEAAGRAIRRAAHRDRDRRARHRGEQHRGSAGETAGRDHRGVRTLRHRSGALGRARARRRP